MPCWMDQRMKASPESADQRVPSQSNTARRGRSSRTEATNSSPLEKLVLDAMLPGFEVGILLRGIDVGGHQRITNREVLNPFLILVHDVAGVRCRSCGDKLSKHSRADDDWMSVPLVVLRNQHPLVAFG